VRLALAVLVLPLLAAAPAAASPVLPDGTYRYEMRIGGTSIGTSTIVIRRRDDAIEITESAAIAGRTLASTRFVDARTFATRSYEVQADGNRFTMSIAGNDATLTHAGSSVTIASPAGVRFLVSDNTAAGFALMPATFAATGSKELTLACVCGSFVAVPVTLTASARGSATISVQGQTATLRFDPASDVLYELDLPAQNLALVLQSHDSGTAAPPAAVVPTPLLLPSPNYAARQVTIVADDGVKLAGTLTLPNAAATRFPALLLVHGSGCNDRDETIGPNKIFAQIANRLSNDGYAALRYDKRSCGRSGGTFPVRQRLIADARNALAFLRSQPGIDPKRIYVLGHSEGGELAPSIAIEDRHLRGIVLLAPPARPLEQILMQQLLRNAEAQQRPVIVRAEQAAFEAIRTGKRNSAEARWLRSSFGIDPATLIARVPCAILILQGTKDIQVLPADTPRLVRAAQRAHRDLTVVMLAGDDHLFINLPAAAASSAGEYFVPSYLDPAMFAAMEQWLTHH